MKRFLRIGTYIGIGAVLLFIGGIGWAQDTIRIGFFAPITGPAAADGASAKNAVELGVKELNDAGGIGGKKIDLIVYDDRLNPQEAVAIANKLIEKASWRGEWGIQRANPTAPFFRRQDATVAGYAVHPDVNWDPKEAKRFCFATVFSEIEVRVAEYAVKNMRRRARSIFMDNDFGRHSSGFAEKAEKPSQFLPNRCTSS
jgi:branched-chain amino acid transport system substrate-binding protein